MGQDVFEVAYGHKRYDGRLPAFDVNADVVPQSFDEKNLVEFDAYKTIVAFDKETVFKNGYRRCVLLFLEVVRCVLCVCTGKLSCLMGKFEPLLCFRNSFDEIAVVDGL